MTTLLWRTQISQQLFIDILEKNYYRTKYFYVRIGFWNEDGYMFEGVTFNFDEYIQLLNGINENCEEEIVIINGKRKFGFDPQRRRFKLVIDRPNGALPYVFDAIVAPSELEIIKFVDLELLLSLTIEMQLDF